MKAIRRSQSNAGNIRANCTARTAICRIAIRCPRCSRSIRRWAPAKPAAASVASSASTTASSIPDETKTLAGGAVKPWQTKSYKECQDDLVKFAKKRDIPLDTPWYALTDAQRKWVIEGEGKWEKKVWYGAKRFFEWLETKAYKMHVRVLLSRYRAYTPCTACDGSRLKPDALLWRIDGQNVHDLMLLPLDVPARSSTR